MLLISFLTVFYLIKTFPASIICFHNQKFCFSHYLCNQIIWNPPGSGGHPFPSPPALLVLITHFVFVELQEGPSPGHPNVLSSSPGPGTQRWHDKCRMNGKIKPKRPTTKHVPQSLANALVRVHRLGQRTETCFLRSSQSFAKSVYKERYICKC